MAYFVCQTKNTFACVHGFGTFIYQSYPEYDDFVDPLTFDCGPITHEQRKELLQSINQYVPRRRSAKNNTDADNADTNGFKK